jgi:hypothetical protein
VHSIYQSPCPLRPLTSAPTRTIPFPAPAMSMPGLIAASSFPRSPTQYPQLAITIPTEYPPNLHRSFRDSNSFRLHSASQQVSPELLFELSNDVRRRIQFFREDRRTDDPGNLPCFVNSRVGVCDDSNTSRIRPRGIRRTVYARTAWRVYGF